MYAIHALRARSAGPERVAGRWEEEEEGQRISVVFRVQSYPGPRFMRGGPRNLNRCRFNDIGKLRVSF